MRSLAAGLAFIERGAPECLRRLRRPRQGLDVRQRLQRGGECSYEVAVSATFDGCDQELEVERSRRRWG